MIAGVIKKFECARLSEEQEKFWAFEWKGGPIVPLKK